MLLPLVFFSLVIISLATGCDRGSRKAGQPNVLLISIDTLRADHLSCYGYSRQTSPNLDALAARGVRFDQAWVQWPKTTPSLASMMTATYPKDNGLVRRVGGHVSGEFRMFAETMKKRGYRTGAVVSNGAVGKEFRFDQGFDDFLETWKSGERPPEFIDQNRAEIVNRQGLSIVDSWSHDQPFFLWLHYLDPHWPYWPPEKPFQFFDSAPDQPLHQKLQSAEHDRELDRDSYSALYDAEIHYADGKIAEMLAVLEARGMMKNTIVVITSDHGESLGEHGYFYDHGKLGFENTLRVPLIVVWPDNISPKVDSSPVSLIDLVPTLMELTGDQLDNGRYMQGRSFRRRLQSAAVGEGDRDESDRPIYAFAEAGYGMRGNWQRIVRDQRFKLFYARAGAVQRFFAGKGEEFALYDLANDPGETTDVYAQNPGDAQRLRAELARWVHADKFETHVDQADGADSSGMSEETREQLEALGYL